MHLIRMPAQVRKTGRSRASIYRDISKGIWTEPVHLGPRTSAWPESEIDALMAARAGGASDDDIRKLVTQLMAERRATAKAMRTQRFEAAVRLGILPRELAAKMDGGTET